MNLRYAILESLGKKSEFQTLQKLKDYLVENYPGLDFSEDELKETLSVLYNAGFVDTKIVSNSRTAEGGIIEMFKIKITQAGYNSIERQKESPKKTIQTGAVINISGSQVSGLNAQTQIAGRDIHAGVPPDIVDKFISLVEEQIKNSQDDPSVIESALNIWNKIKSNKLIRKAFNIVLPMKID